MELHFDVFACTRLLVRGTVHVHRVVCYESMLLAQRSVATSLARWDTYIQLQLGPYVEMLPCVGG